MPILDKYGFPRNITTFEGQNYLGAWAPSESTGGVWTPQALPNTTNASYPTAGREYTGSLGAMGIIGKVGPEDLVITTGAKLAARLLHSDDDSTYETYGSMSPTYTALTIAFVDGGAGVADYLTDTAEGFITAGFKAGQILTIKGSTSNNYTAPIVSVTAGRIYVATATVTAEVLGDTVVLTAYSPQGNMRYGDTFKDVATSTAADPLVITMVAGHGLAAGDKVIPRGLYNATPIAGVNDVPMTVHSVATNALTMWDGDNETAIDASGTETGAGGVLQVLETGKYLWECVNHFTGSLTIPANTVLFNHTFGYDTKQYTKVNVEADYDASGYGIVVVPYFSR